MLKDYLILSIFATFFWKSIDIFGSTELGALPNSVFWILMVIVFLFAFLTAFRLRIMSHYSLVLSKISNGEQLLDSDVKYELKHYVR